MIFSYKDLQLKLMICLNIKFKKQISWILLKIQWFSIKISILNTWRNWNVIDSNGTMILIFKIDYLLFNTGCLTDAIQDIADSDEK